MASTPALASVHRHDTPSTRSGRPQHGSARRSDLLPALLFILPSFAGFFLFVLFPVLSSFGLSFTKWNLLSGFGGIELVGLDNFVRLFRDSTFLTSLRNNVVFSFTTVPITQAIGLALAVLIVDWAYFKNAFKVAIFLPYISSIVAVSVVWMVILHPSSGPVNQLLVALGVDNPPRWFVDIDWALASIIVMTIWQNLGYTVLIYVAALNAINPSLYEAGRMDGANPVQEFFRITIPMVSPTSFFLLITNIIGSFRVFDQISVITGGGPGDATNVLAYYMYQTAFQQYRMGYASSIAWVLFVVIFAITMFQKRMQKTVVYE
jgi:multiple sugar transport system permease protein